MNKIKCFLDDLDTIYKIDKSKMNELLLMQLGMLIFSIIMSTISNYYYFLILNLIIPIAFLMTYNSFYKPMIRKVQREIELQEKYSYLYSKFINGGKE